MEDSTIIFLINNKIETIKGLIAIHQKDIEEYELKAKDPKYNYFLCNVSLAHHKGYKTALEHSLQSMEDLLGLVEA